MRTLGPEDSSSGGVIPLPSTLSIDALESLGHTINFVDNWLQFLVTIVDKQQVYTKLIWHSYSSKFYNIFL